MSGSAEPPAGGDLIPWLKDRIGAGDSPELDPVELAKVGQAPGGEAELRVGLESLAEAGAVRRTTKTLCPIATCGAALSADDVAAARCPRCETDYRETGDEPLSRAVYRIAGDLSREIQWAVVAHGMNTRGPWQEELSWRLSNKFRVSAPVLIYKYGFVQLGVLFEFRHRALVRALGKDIRRAVGFAGEFGRRRAPDMILHSFGTLLFARLLEDPDFQDLRFGRVILAGSIVRPDHVLARHLESGRVEAILNHCGSTDRIVDLAAWFIPRSGPSGRVGLRDRASYSIVTPDWGHSTYFEPDGLTEDLRPNGLWDRFLRRPLATFEGERMPADLATAWRPMPSWVQPTVRVLMGLAALGLGALTGFGLAWLGAWLLGPQA